MDNSSSLRSFGNSTQAAPCPRFDWFAVEVEHPAYLCQLGVSGLGLLLNCLTLCVFATGKEFKGAPFVLMWALALADVCNLLFKAPECFVMATREKPKRLQFVKDAKLYMYYMWSNYLNPLCNITENVSVWLIVSLALERYISMKHYNISKTRCTSRNAVIVTLGILAVAFLINVFSFFGMRAHYGQDGNETFVGGKASHFYSTVWYEACVWLRACAAQFLPLVFLAVANCRLIFVLHRQSRKMKKYSRPASGGSGGGGGSGGDPRAAAVSPVKRSSMNSRRQMAQRRLTIMLIVVIGLVLFGQVPQAFSFHKLFIFLFSCPPGCTLDRCLVYRKYKLLANVPNLLCYSCNFFIYFALNKHFRGHVFRIFTCAACRGQPGRRPSANGLYTAQPDRAETVAATTAAGANASATAANPASSAGAPLLRKPSGGGDQNYEDEPC